MGPERVPSTGNEPVSLAAIVPKTIAFAFRHEGIKILRKFVRLRSSTSSVESPFYTYFRKSGGHSGAFARLSRIPIDALEYLGVMTVVRKSAALFYDWAYETLLDADPPTVNGGSGGIFAHNLFFKGEIL